MSANSFNASNLDELDVLLDLRSVFLPCFSFGAGELGAGAGAGASGSFPPTYISSSRTGFNAEERNWS